MTFESLLMTLMDGQHIRQSSLQLVIQILKYSQHFRQYVCRVITYSRVWIKRIRSPILLVVS